MKNLTVINRNGVLCVDSREVANILEIEHKELFRKIKGGKNVKGYIELMNEKYLLANDYFIPSTYQDGDGKTRKNFLITRQGCQLIAQNDLGKVAIIFTAKYIKNFNEINLEHKNIQNTEMEAVKRLIYYATTKGNGNIENYYKLITKLACKIVGISELEKGKNNSVQWTRKTILEDLIHYIIVVGIKLNLSEEEICEVYRERVEAFQKAISQEYKE